MKSAVAAALRLINYIVMLRGFLLYPLLKRANVLSAQKLREQVPLVTVPASMKRGASKTIAAVTTEQNDMLYNSNRYQFTEHGEDDKRYKNFSNEGEQPDKKCTKLKLVQRLPKLLFMVVLNFHIVFIASTALILFIYKWVTPIGTTLELVRKYSYHYKIKQPIPVQFKSIPLYVRSMLIAIEDYKFYNHHGFDLEGIKRAIEINSRIKRPLYGGSTISMQTARTLFLTPTKSYIRKYLEAIITVELELILSKNRILELYFSLAEWGKGIFGIEQASLCYYKHKIKQCSRDESARLIALLSSPILYTPYTLSKNHLLLQRYNFLYKKYCQ